MYPCPAINLIQGVVHGFLIDSLAPDHWNGFPETEEECQRFGGETDLVCHKDPPKSFTIQHMIPSQHSCSKFEESLSFKDKYLAFVSMSIDSQSMIMSNYLLWLEL